MFLQEDAPFDGIDWPKALESRKNVRLVITSSTSPPSNTSSDLCGPYVWPRTSSDYWLYAELFSSTCLGAIDNDELIGAVVAFRSQDKPDNIYVQDVVTHANHRRRGVSPTRWWAPCASRPPFAASASPPSPTTTPHEPPEPPSASPTSPATTPSTAYP